MERIGVPQTGLFRMDAGGLPTFPGANAANQLNTNIHLQHQQLQQQQHQSQSLQHQHLSNQNLLMRQTHSINNNYSPVQQLPSNVQQQHQQQQQLAVASQEVAKIATSQYISNEQTVDLLNSCNQQQQQLQPLQQDILCKSNGIDRLKKRMDVYRRHHTDCGPRFDQTFNGVCEQQNLETCALQKRFLENKAKKAAKKSDKKQSDPALGASLQSSVHVVSNKCFICCRH